MEIKLVNKVKDNIYRSNDLKISLIGKDINHVYVNTLRRIILEEIPSYGINPSLINIKKNSFFISLKINVEFIFILFNINCKQRMKVIIIN